MSAIRLHSASVLLMLTIECFINIYLNLQRFVVTFMQSNGSKTNLNRGQGPSFFFQRGLSNGVCFDTQNRGPVSVLDYSEAMASYFTILAETASSCLKVAVLYRCWIRLVWLTPHVQDTAPLNCFRIMLLTLSPEATAQSISTLASCSLISF